MQSKNEYYMNIEKVLVPPYEGDEGFIFVSYSHENKDEALSMIGQLQKDGYRVWYDEGVHPGSEWDEYIAQYIARCSLFLVLLSDEYLLSSNCKDELNYARNKEKNRVLVYLKDIDLPAGMELRLSRLQNIHKSNYEDEDTFYKKLYTSSGIEKCYTGIDVRTKHYQYYILNTVTCEEIRLEYGSYLVGRDTKKCTILVNDIMVSRVHAIITIGMDIVTIRDLNSASGIKINGDPAEPGTEYRIQDKDCILVGDTRLVLLCKAA